MAKKYDISFGIYDIEAQEWITEDGEHRIEDFIGHISDFNSLSTKIIQMIEQYEEHKVEDKLASKINEAVEEEKEF